MLKDFIIFGVKGNKIKNAVNHMQLRGYINTEN